LRKSGKKFSFSNPRVIVSLNISGLKSDHTIPIDILNEIQSHLAFEEYISFRKFRKSHLNSNWFIRSTMGSKPFVQSFSVTLKLNTCRRICRSVWFWKRNRIVI
jgi:hypothetical protein